MLSFQGPVKVGGLQLWFSELRPAEGELPGFGSRVRSAGNLGAFNWNRLARGPWVLAHEICRMRKT